MGRPVCRLSRIVFLLVATGLACEAGRAQGMPAYVNLGASQNAFTWGTGQQVPMNTVVGGYAGTAAPTGTVQYLANGQLIGAPVSLDSIGSEAGQGLSTGSEMLSIAVPGSYVLTARYSGDANYAPVSSSYSWPVTVETNPPTITPVATPASLSFTAGATTGNTLTITMANQGGCNCGGSWTTTIGPAPGTTLPANAPTLTIVAEPADANGNIVYQVVIASQAQKTITSTASLREEWMMRGLPAILSVGLFPMFWRRRRPATVFSVCVLALLPVLSGCGTQAPANEGLKTTTTTVPDSAGSYVVTVTGGAFSLTTYTYFSLQAPVTIQ